MDWGSASTHEGTGTHRFQFQESGHIFQHGESAPCYLHEEREQDFQHEQGGRGFQRGKRGRRFQRGERGRGFQQGVRGKGFQCGERTKGFQIGNTGIVGNVVENKLNLSNNHVFENGMKIQSNVPNQRRGSGLGVNHRNHQGRRFGKNKQGDYSKGGSRSIGNSFECVLNQDVNSTLKSDVSTQNKVPDQRRGKRHRKKNSKQNKIVNEEYMEGQTQISQTPTAGDWVDAFESSNSQCSFSCEWVTKDSRQISQNPMGPGSKNSKLKGGNCSDVPLTTEGFSPDDKLISNALQSSNDASSGTRNTSKRIQAVGRNQRKNINRSINKEHETLERVLSQNDLESILKHDTEEIIHILATDIEAFINIIKNELEPKMLLLIIGTLRKVCSANLSSERADILREATMPLFLDKIFNFVSDYPYIEDKEICDVQSVTMFFENIIIFYETLLGLMPSGIRIWKTHLIEVEKAFKATVRQFGSRFFECVEPEKILNIRDLIKDIDRMTNQAAQVITKSTTRKRNDKFHLDPVGDFRTVSLFPRPDDVFGKQPFLYPNIVEGPYRSVEHYLDIHFKLLREDFMGPIRQGLKEYKAQYNTNGKFKRIDNVRIYRKVKFLCPKTIFDKVCYEVCFDVDNKLTRVNWEMSNRFMFGSLLLFTSDHFDTFFLGTVANKSVKHLQNKSVTVELQGSLPNTKLVLSKEFVMAESEAFFLPYFNVLKSLQFFNSSNFPLSKYIVDVNTETSIPAYLEGYYDEYYVDHVQYTVEGINKDFTFNILDDEEWPSCENLGLDIAQYEAYKAALTNDMVVIQGPPGTGKTFLGLQITKALLRNSHFWCGNEYDCNSSPILVVCYTNHALDQFLEGLLNVTTNLVRIGGRSKDTELDKFNIRERRKEYSYFSKTNSKQIRQAQIQMSAVFGEIIVLQTNLYALNSSNGILSLKTLGLVAEYLESFFGNDDNLVDWLLVGAGETKQKVKVTVTERGIVRTTQADDQIVDEEDQRMRQIFFDQIDFDSSVTLSEDTITVYFACSITNIKKKKEQIEKKLHNNKAKKCIQTKQNSTLTSLDKVLKYLETKLNGQHLICSDNERERLMNVRDLYGLDSNDRWKLYFFWVNILQTGLMVELECKQAEFKEYGLKYERLRQANDLQILKRSHVVGTTTTLAAQYQSMLNDLAPKIVIVEEAAEVLEAHIIASLSKACEHLIMIGDHKQLRPSVADNRLARQYHLDVSLFERMVKNNMACHTLMLQHRMRPEISQQLVPTIYPTLRDHVSVMEREHIKGMEKNVFFMTHNHFEEEVQETTSKQNLFESHMILKLAKYLVLQGYSPEEITILTPYKGQMQCIKNEIREMGDLPKGIHITQVDTFQGEENRIILLSLVRSNAAKKIGFLSTENRVCVALSRARDGLYIFGNMDMLVSRSELWSHIRESFKRQNAVGPELRLRCQNHLDMVTSISSASDFRKVSEGGCSLICGQVLPCSHKCKSLCHVEKDYHKRYNCREQCLRILCRFGHQCPKKCHMKCGDCQFITECHLPCGHTANVPCSMDSGNYDCLKMVEVVVPKCGHIVTSPCYERKIPLCTNFCMNRLDCGHSCEKLCHEDNDPQHTQYQCNKPCARLNIGCSEDHTCKLLCYEECKPCLRTVEKKLACGHSTNMICNTNPSTIQCTKMCNRTLKCGHKCMKRCWEPCNPCHTKVEKAVPGCGHSIKVACSKPPTKQLCDGQCPVKLACGHPCKLKCKETCSVSNCEYPKYYKKMLFTSFPCGHKNATYPCKLEKTFKSMPAEEQMKYCSQPCGKPLSCSHLCSGTCGECWQGRIHKICDEPCGNILICGHSCDVPCRDVCPPCDKPCRHVCNHSKCPKKCGQVCVMCTEPCDYQCPHLKCTKRCGDLCDRGPCYKDCEKILRCNHQCVGFCGETCPPCHQCEPHHFEEFFYTGGETEDNAKWVYLEDCKHTFESSGLEYWLNVKEEGREIVAKACPRCKTPIVKVQRFMNLIKTVYKDIQVVKSKCFGKPEDIEQLRSQLWRKLQNTHFEELHAPNEPTELWRLYFVLWEELSEINNKNRKTFVDDKRGLLLHFQTEFFIKFYKKKSECWDTLNTESKMIVTKKINQLTYLLLLREKKINEQEMLSFECELNRIHRMCDLMTYLNSVQYRMLANSSMSRALKAKAENLIFSLTVYDVTIDSKVIAVLDKLKEYIKSSVEISREEKAMISEAMKSSFSSHQKVGHWFKCRNGHTYCITECGGAMEQTVCPVPGCGLQIGGINHALLGDQVLASDMDGAQHPAWSNQNNMANFGFVQ